jgi:hypothetical protein
MSSRHLHNQVTVADASPFDPETGRTKSSKALARAAAGQECSTSCLCWSAHVYSVQYGQYPYALILVQTTAYCTVAVPVHWPVWWPVLKYTLPDRTAVRTGCRRDDS